MYKNEDQKLFKIMFPKEIKDDNYPPMYMESYVKVRNNLKRCAGDTGMLLKQFSWENFTEDMYKFLSKIADELEMPFFNKCTSNEISLKSPKSSKSPTTSNNANNVSVVIEDVSQKEVDKRRSPDNELVQDVSSNNNGLDGSKEELENMMSYIDINDQASLSNKAIELESDSLSNGGEPYSSISECEQDNKSDNSQQTTSLTQLTAERSSISLTDILPEQQAEDDRQSSSEESAVGTPENNTRNLRKRGEKRVRYNTDHSDYRMTKRVRNLWNEQEVRALEEGMRQYGKLWSNIKKNYGSKGQVLEHRTPVQLKDKARSELVRRQRENIEPGVFGIMAIL
ncbi:hypothetical protein C1645_762996 [Glomus cerebriforme]|uniref:Uncharacterized protein n=1 Tax=Glomus cerebriforme TaxID=658196 RepID=A0A397T481_9GLOM|nr:hypothetical protein C1645_762996 [Glomus cerebriforme]